MTISLEQFKQLVPGRHQIIDCHKLPWHVKDNSKHGVVLVSPGNSEELFWWQNGFITDQIGIDVTINHPQAQVVTLA